MNGLTLVLYTDLTAVICLFPVWLFSEASEVQQAIFLKPLAGYLTTQVFQQVTTPALVYALSCGLFSLMQTFASFYVIVHATTLTYAVLNVTKRALLIVGRCLCLLLLPTLALTRCSIYFFGDSFTRTHLIGLMIAFAGVSWYTRIKLKEKKAKGMVRSTNTSVV